MPGVAWKIKERGLSLHFQVEIERSQIHLTVNANTYSPDDIAVLYKHALDIARTVVELAAFKKGYGVFVLLSRFVDPDGVSKELVLGCNENLARICTAFDLTDGFPQMWRIVQLSPAIFAILNDLIASITVPHVATVNCARAIDGIRQLIGGSGTDKQQWSAMRQTLRVDREYLQFITDRSKGPRHGNRLYLDGVAVTEIVERSWTIMNRFLEYKKSGDKPLPASFPELHG